MQTFTTYPTCIDTITLYGVDLEVAYACSPYRRQLTDEPEEPEEWEILSVRPYARDPDTDGIDIAALLFAIHFDRAEELIIRALKETAGDREP